MSVTVGAALKRIAVAILTNPKVLKTVGGIVLGIIIIIIMPIVAVVSIFSGDIEIDTGRLQTMVVENLSAEEQAKLQFVEDTMYGIEEEMEAAGFGGLRVTEAQVLFTLCLYDRAQEEGFISRLTGCFAEDQTDAQLIGAVNAAFGTEISAEEFSQIMDAIRSVYIDTSGYIDPYTKNNLDLVTWAKEAKDNGWGYVWGTYGSVLTKSYYNAKLEQYPEEIGGYAEFIEANWLGRRTADCNGLIKGYGWLNPDTHEVEYGTNGMPDIGADTMYTNASEKGTIDSIPEIPGLAVWHEGHIGIYIGDGKVIEAKGTKYGVVETELSAGGWTHWLKIPYITYIDGELGSAPEEKKIWDALYAKIGNPYGVAGLMGTSMRKAGFCRITCRTAMKLPSVIRMRRTPLRWTAGRMRTLRPTALDTDLPSGQYRTGRKAFWLTKPNTAHRLPIWICSLPSCAMSWRQNSPMSLRS